MPPMPPPIPLYEIRRYIAGEAVSALTENAFVRAWRIYEVASRRVAQGRSKFYRAEFLVNGQVRVVSDNTDKLTSHV